MAHSAMDTVAAQAAAHRPSATAAASLVVDAAVVAEVFDGESVPFPLNPDGSADRSVYMAWLNATGMRALAAFAECSEPAKQSRGAAAIRK